MLPSSLLVLVKLLLLLLLLLEPPALVRLERKVKPARAGEYAVCGR